MYSHFPRFSRSSGNPDYKMHSSRMHTASSSSHHGGSPPGTPHPHPWEQTIPPGSRPPPGPGTPQEQTTPWEQTPQNRHPMEQTPPWEKTPPEQAPCPLPEQAPPPVDRITDACENITLPQLRCRR